jgi:parvulin-like peptidyl-prolyl isomerase
MAQIRRQIVQSAVPDFIKRQLLLQEARRLGMKPSSNAMERAERDFGKIASSMGMTADDLRRSQLPQAAVIREAYEAAPLIDALLQEKVYPEVQVTDEFVSNTIFTIGQENKTIEERNEKKKASLEEWRSQTMAGSDFGALADKHSEYPGPAKGDGGYWGVFDRSQIQDRDMSNTIFSMNTNEVSKVLEDEEGYRIVKVLNKNPAVKNEKQEIVERESCELAHIFLMREPLLMNMQPAAMKRELLRQSKERLTDEYVQKLKTQACIEFPHGTNLWAKASGTNTVRRPAHPRRTAVQGIEGTRTNSLRVFGAEVIVPQR